MTIDTTNLTQDQINSLEYEADLLLDLEIIFKPHSGQVPAIKAFFEEGKKGVFIECGRKFGKSEFTLYYLYRYALTNPNSACYYIAPFQKQAKELIWANNRLQNFFMPKLGKDKRSHSCTLFQKGLSATEASEVMNQLRAKYGMSVNNTEMRITFGNGSFIKLDGADNFEAYRGINPHAIAYDEFKDHHPKFHDGMGPNLATFEAPLLVVGTPPEGDEDNAKNFCELADYFKVDDENCYINAPTYTNPHISVKWLKKEKQRLLAIGKEDVWLREYMSQRVKAGSRSIFPMLSQKMVKSQAEMIRDINRHWKDWDILQVFDPASVSCFGHLLIAVNQYDKRIYVLDEIYAEKKEEMVTSAIWPLAEEKRQILPHVRDDIRAIYDHAAAWFQNEVADVYEVGLEPCIKDVGKDKENRLNLIKELLLLGYVTISDKCIKFFWEMESYRTDEKGKIPKINDHLIDCFRYGLAAIGYNMVPERKKFDMDERRGFTIEDDLASQSSSEMEGYLNDLYEREVG